MGVESFYKTLKNKSLNEDQLNEEGKKRPRTINFKKIYNDCYNVCYENKLANAEITVRTSEGVEGNDKFSGFEVYIQWPYHSDNTRDENKQEAEDICGQLKEYRFMRIGQSVPKSNLIRSKLFFTDYEDQYKLLDDLEKAGFDEWDNIKKIDEEVTDMSQNINGIFKELRSSQNSVINEEHEVVNEENTLQYYGYIDEDGDVIDMRDPENPHIRTLDDFDEEIGEYEITEEGDILYEGAVSDKDIEKQEEPDREAKKEGLPQLQHVYWDKSHRNAYYVVAVYPKDNKVSYWNQDGDRRQTTIKDFMTKYELSTNEDDYDLFEERKEDGKMLKKDVDTYKIEKSQKFLERLAEYFKKYKLPVKEHISGTQTSYYSFFNSDHNNIGVLVNKKGDIACFYYNLPGVGSAKLLTNSKDTKDHFDEVLSKAYSCLKVKPKVDKDFVDRWVTTKREGEVVKMNDLFESNEEDGDYENDREMFENISKDLKKDLSNINSKLKDTYSFYDEYYPEVREKDIYLMKHSFNIGLDHLGGYFEGDTVDTDDDNYRNYKKRVKMVYDWVQKVFDKYGVNNTDLDELTQYGFYYIEF